MNEIKGTRILGAPNADFTNPIKDVYTARLPIAGIAGISIDGGWF